MAGPLHKRNEASIRYRMRNISYICNQKNLPTLRSYSPAPQVGGGVRKRIEKILEEYSEILLKLNDNSIKAAQKLADSYNEVLLKLEQVENRLSNVEYKIIGKIGHNNPPEAIDSLHSYTEEAKESVRRIKLEITTSFPDKDKIEKEKMFLLSLA